MIVYLCVFVLFAVAAGVYQYFLWQSQYWRRRGVPGPPSRLFYGHSKELTNFHEPSPFKLHEWAKKYGKIYGLKEGVRNALVISDIDMINEIFVKQFDIFYGRPDNPVGPNLDKDPRVHLFEARGARWKRLRALASPSFSTNSLKKIEPIIDDSAVKMVDLMGEKHGDGASFDVHRYFNEFTLDTICRLVIGQAESTMFANPRLEIFQAIFLMRADNPTTYLANGIPQIGWIFREISKITLPPVFKNAMKIFAEIEANVSKRVEERKRSGPPATPADMIDIFLDDAAEFDYENRGEFSKSNSITKAITVDEVISQAFVFLLAGYDTTSNALAYTAWTLSRHPNVMRRCQEEVDELCHEAAMTHEATQKMRYLDAVCRETLRFYPLAARAIARSCMKDTRIGGYDIEKDTIVVGDTYAVHFSKKLWGEDAEEFRPERWLDPDRRISAINFLAFGAGPRLCIGMRLAMMEQKIALAHLLRKFDIFADETVSDLKLVGCTSVSPEKVPIKILPRVY